MMSIVYFRMLRDICGLVQIEIEDDGNGIAPEIQNIIFERFSTAGSFSNSLESTGIGLRLTRSLVELHKGRIELVSKKDEGTTFSLFFNKSINKRLEHNNPKEMQTQQFRIEETKEEISVLPDTELSISPFGDKKILIVEDNPDLREFLLEKLQDFFNVHSASNGKTAFDICLETMPDLVISDIMIPEMNGYELCHAIKSDERICHIPVILLTAKTDTESELIGFKSGADAFVRKPFALEVIIARVVSLFYSRQQIWKRIGDNPFASSSEVIDYSKEEKFLQKVTQIINDHMSSPDFSVELLAQYIDISKNNLNAKIKALTGKTSVQFIRLLRLRRAAELLKSTDNRVSEITYLVGYSDLQHFRVQFKKEFSLTPSQFKEEFTFINS